MDQLTKKYLTQEIFVFSLSYTVNFSEIYFKNFFLGVTVKKNPNYFSTCWFKVWMLSQERKKQVLKGGSILMILQCNNY